jgi:hypothetical protein
VSDSHSVPSHPVRPKRAAPLKLASPIPAPCTVTLADPDTAPFLRFITLPAALSPESISVTLPTACPTLIHALLLPATPWLASPRKDVSDSHTDSSPAVPPCLHPPVCPASPRFAPCIVTRIEPVETPFDRPTTLSTGPDTENTALTLPTLPCTLTDTRWLPDVPCPTLHRIHVSDSHAVTSHPVRPTRAAPVDTSSPIPAPTTVTLADPVAARFVGRITLNAPRSTDCAIVTLPPPCPTVADIRPLPRVETPIRPDMHVSDTHSVRSAAVPPALQDPVYPANPIPDPNTLKANEPVDGELGYR